MHICPCQGLLIDNAVTGVLVVQQASVLADRAGSRCPLTAACVQGYVCIVGDASIGCWDLASCRCCSCRSTDSVDSESWHSCRGAGIVLHKHTGGCSNQRRITVRRQHNGVVPGVLAVQYCTHMLSQCGSSVIRSCVCLFDGCVLL